MWPLGHAAVGYLLYSLSARARFGGRLATLPTVALLVGTQAPDLVDKPLAWYAGVLPTGRSLGHSLLVVVPICLAVYWLARRRGRAELGVAFGIGAVSHPLVDSVPALWSGTEVNYLLYPVVPVTEYEEGAPTLADLLAGSLGEPWFLLEFALAGAALLAWHRDGRPGLGTVERVLRRATRST
ncbi:metal-dependent hydrolase [Saliphagus infecundisoli]|uniref:Metal-dependent hydrolase n=1 Tax=Saliphagus infecundisoli TaxID=1849069 RepID=A0ABD5QAE4_9EURY|nr:metal-dependent hydrolase [Saliphagus infecundisoli]